MSKALTTDKLTTSKNSCHVFEMNWGMKRKWQSSGSGSRLTTEVQYQRYSYQKCIWLWFVLDDKNKSKTQNHCKMKKTWEKSKNLKKYRNLIFGLLSVSVSHFVSCFKITYFLCKKNLLLFCLLQWKEIRSLRETDLDVCTWHDIYKRPWLIQVYHSLVSETCTVQ